METNLVFQFVFTAVYFFLIKINFARGIRCRFKRRGLSDRDCFSKQHYFRTLFLRKVRKASVKLKQ